MLILFICFNCLDRYFQFNWDNEINNIELIDRIYFQIVYFSSSNIINTVYIGAVVVQIDPIHKAI